MVTAAGCNTAVDNAVDIAVGAESACLINADGGVECWGQLQSGGNIVVIDYGSTAVPIAELPSGVTDIAVGQGHACAIDSGNVKCWGDNGVGQLGIGNTSDSTVPVDVIGLPAGDAAVQVDAYYNFSCVRLASGAVWCWGFGNVGQLGNGLSQHELSPVQVTGLDGTPGNKVIDIALGVSHACALRPNGTVGCWGSDARGQLGNGPGQVDSAVPAPVPNLVNIVAIESGRDHMCASTVVGVIFCWGDNPNDAIASGGGQLDSPTTYTLFTNLVARMSGSAGRNCVIYVDDSAHCVGSGVAGALGNGTTSDSAVPSLVVGTDLAGVTEIDSNRFNGCAVGTSGDVRCWGHGFLGTLGNGNTADSSVPVSVIR